MEETRDEKLIMNFGAINKDTKQKVDHTWDCNKQLDRDVFLEKCNIAVSESVADIGALMKSLMN